jgi:methionyl-tRNA synthetase
MTAPKTPATKTILVTHALPYANGPLHIGHLLGYIQSDIWVRARRMAGDTVHFVAADDVHGTPIMLAAEKADMTPEAFIAGIYDGHVRDFTAFGIRHDCYYTTHSPENRELAELVYTRLKAGGHIAARSIRQLYDPVRQMFLPDRYVKGICPNCGTPDQYGDNCENCGATYAPTDLKDPRSVLSGATPELRDSEHYFFKVGDFSAMLQDWLAGKLTGGAPVVHSSVAAKLKEWLDAEGGVRDWDISRDAPYFGFPIPDAPGKFFYVWLDAPIGYLASFKKLCAGVPVVRGTRPVGKFMQLDAATISSSVAEKDLVAASFDEFLQVSDPKFDAGAEMHHFLGKDIVNFHGLFWPAMLKGAGLRTPDALHVNGYLTVNGEKMSKSRGTFVMARTYLDAGLDADHLRYYFATMLTAAPIDLDLDLKAFEDRVNSHLVGKWVNLASRCAGFVHKLFDGRLASTLPAAERAMYDAWAAKLAPCAALYRACDYAGVTRLLVEVADEANAYVATKAPWLLAKDEGKREELHVACTLALNGFRLLSIWLNPVVPAIGARARAFLAEDWTHFDAANAPALGTRLAEFSTLTTRIDPKKIETMIEASKESLKPTDSAPAVAGAASAAIPGDESSKKSIAAEAAPAKAESGTPLAATIGIDDFAKLDLRIGKVLACEFVDGSDKLLRFELDAGELGKRQIFSGIRAAYGEPDKLVGRNVVFIANLAPRKMRFGMSEGMILSAGTGGDDLFLLDADAGAKPGATVK